MAKAKNKLYFSFCFCFALVLFLGGGGVRGVGGVLCTFLNICKIHIHLLVILVKHSLIQIISKIVLLKEQGYYYSTNKKLLN